MPGSKPPQNFLAVWWVATAYIIAAKNILRTGKSVILITIHPLAGPETTVWLEWVYWIFCTVFYFCCAPSLQFCYRRDVPLGRPGSLVEIPKEKCSAKLLPVLQISVISAIDFVAPSNFLSVVWLGLSGCMVNFNKCCCPLPVIHRDLQSLCCDHTCKVTFNQRQSSWPSVSCPRLAENLSSSQLSSVHSFASWAHC